jgi:hypothetical protein
MPKIKVDLQMLLWLEQRRDPDHTYNDVIRDELGLPPLPRPAPPPPSWPPLLPLIQAGLLQPGQKLTWHRPRRREVFTVTVNEQGHLVTDDGVECETPNVAARVIAGYPTQAWPLWRTTDGTSLAELRDRLPATTKANLEDGGSSMLPPTTHDN